MSKSFYTNVQCLGSKILYRGVEHGQRKRYKVDYSPTLYLPAKSRTNFTTIHGEYVSEIKPGTIRECRDFVKQYEDVENFKIYGNQRYEYAYISEENSGEVEWDKQFINICNIDIEVGSENGFPDPATATEPIISIAYKTGDRITVIGFGDFDSSNYSNTTYIKCNGEIELIKTFLSLWTTDYPDIVTGWNVKFFDIPYLINRIKNLLGEEFAKKLSPWNYMSERTAFIMGRHITVQTPLGVSILDYFEMYRKYAPGGMSQENYKLDTICHEELGERKLSYEEYGNLHTLYKEDYQKFIEYNIRDVELVDKLDDKLKLIDLALTLAYDSKTNYEDVFTQVRMWDSLIYNHLKKRNIIVPPTEKRTKKEAYVGAYVKDPIIGMHKWIASFDLNSLYPHLIMQFNISPDKFIDPKNYTPEMQEFMLTSSINVDTLLNREIDTSKLKEFGATLTPNGQLFKVDNQGFLAKMMEDMYNGRTIYKKKAIAAKKDLENESEESKRYDIEKRIARYNNLQLAKKVSLNSAYGALGNEFFRFFDVRQASAITTAGQLAIRWIERKLNEYLNKLLRTENKDYVIASDTDSIYLSLDELVSKTIIAERPDATTKDIISFLDKVCENKIQPFIDKSYNELAEYINALDQKMQMKREALADKGIWTAKKRYILNVWDNEGVRYTKPKVKVMGLEVIKSSTPSACRDKFWEAIDVMLNKTENDMIEFIEKFREEFTKLSENEIAFPRGVNGIKDYTDGKTKSFTKGTPIHVRGSILYNLFIEKKKLTKKYPTIKEGEKIKFVYLKEPNTIQSNIIAFPQVIPKEFDLNRFIDYNTQYEKSFVEPLKIILDCIGWKTEKVTSLENFFGD